jgi:hypothetical protein
MKKSKSTVHPVAARGSPRSFYRFSRL